MWHHWWTSYTLLGLRHGHGKCALQGSGRKYKWKKLAAELLQARGGSMKVKKLQRTLLAQVGLPRTDEEAAKQMLGKWVKSPKFDVLEDGVVALTQK